MTNEEKIMHKHSDHRKAAAVSYVNIIITTVFSLVITPLMIGVWGEKEQGLYAGIGAFVNNLSLMEFGFAATITRWTAKYHALGDKKSRENFLAMGLGAYAIIAVVVVVSGSFMAGNIEHLMTKISPEQIASARVMVVIMTINVAVSLVSHVFVGAVNGTGRFFSSKLIATIGLLLRYSATVLLIITGFRSVGITIAALCVTSAVFILNVLIFRAARLRIKYHSFDKELFKEVLHFSGYNFLNVLLIQIYWKLDEVIITAMKDTVQVSIYSVAMRIVDMAQQLSLVFSQFVLPGLTHMEMKKASPKEFERGVVPAGRVCAVMLSFLLIVLTAFGQQFILFWSGKELYAPAYTILLLLLFPALLPWVSTPFNEILKAKNQMRFITFAKLGVSVFNIVLSVILVSKIGIIGAAIGTSVGSIIGDIILRNYYMQKHVGLNIFSYHLRVFHGMVLPVLFTAGTAVLLRFATPERMAFGGRGGLFVSLGVRGVVLAVVYTICMFLFGFTKSEKHKIKNLIKRRKSQ